MNRSNLSNLSSITIKKDLPYYYNHNNTFFNNKKPKPKPKRSHSLVKFFSPNKTIMDYVEKKLIIKKMNHMDNISTGSGSLLSTNNKEQIKMHQSPNNNIRSKNISFQSYHTGGNGLKKNNSSTKLRETNKHLLDQINTLIQENERLKKENEAYKVLFKQFEDKAKQCNDKINIKTLSSYGNYD